MSRHDEFLLRSHYISIYRQGITMASELGFSRIVQVQKSNSFSFTNPASWYLFQIFSSRGTQVDFAAQS